MELSEYFSATNLIIIIIIILLILIGFGSSTFLTWKKLGINGPIPIPFIGTTLEFFTKGVFKADLEWLKKYGRFIGTYEGKRPCLIVGDPDILKNILVKDFNYFSNRRVIKLSLKSFEKSLLILKNDHWRKVRNVVTPSFSTAKLKHLTVLINKCCGILNENLEETLGQSLEIRSVVQNFAADVIASCAFALEINSQKERNHPFVTNLKDLTNVNVVRSLLLVVMPKLEELLQKVGLSLLLRKQFNFYEETVYKIIKMRKENKEKRMDFLQLLLDAENEELKDDENDVDKNEEALLTKVDGSTYDKKGLSPNEILGQCITFIFAGFDTVASLMSFMAYSLAINPDIQQHLIDEIEEVLNNKERIEYEDITKMVYLDQVVSETLRIYPPGIRVDRECNFDYKINNIVLPKGSIVIIPIYALHHDEEFWPDPEKFDPDRFSPQNKPNIIPYTYMPFGIGPRNCIAMRFALLEVKLMMAHVLRKFKFCPCPETEIPLTFKIFGTFNAKNGTWVKLESH